MGRPKKKQPKKPQRQSSRNKSKKPNSAETSPLAGFKTEEIHKSAGKLKELEDSQLEIIVISNSQSQKENSQLNAILIPDSESDENDFDKLLDPKFKKTFPTNKNVRTYTNCNKTKQNLECPILEFEDCRNRDSILEWLNDTRNCFDRMTQTQGEDYEDIFVSLDQPSVSQNKIKKKSKTENKPYNLRARSFDLKQPKPKVDNLRHSLAGDTPSMENYHIEEFETDEEVPAFLEPDTNAKLLINLMEDEYLNSLQEEVDKKNNSGWDRINDLNKLVKPKKKKQPKKLKIDNKSPKNEELRHIQVDNVENFENFYSKNIRELLVVDSEPQVEPDLSEECLKIGLEFLGKLKNLSIEQISVDLQTLLVGLSTFIAKPETCDTQTQTESPQMCHKTTEIENVQMEDVEIQTDDYERVDCDCKNKENLREVNLNSTPDSLEGAVFDTDELLKEIEENKTITKMAHNNKENLQESSKVKERSRTEDDILREIEQSITITNIVYSNNKKAENTLESSKVEKITKIENGFLKEVEENRTITNINNNNNKTLNMPGTSKVEKRNRSPVETIELNPKRPCNRFVKNDLSINFDSCGLTDSEDMLINVDFPSEEDKVPISNKIISDKEVPILQDAKTRTQDIIDECDLIISNVTKPKQKNPEIAIVEKTIEKVQEIQKETDFEYFQMEIIDESPQPSKIRRSLFEKEKGKFSDSMFSSNNTNTSPPSSKHVEDNIDQLLNEIKIAGNFYSLVNGNMPEEVNGRRAKIVILENILLKPADNNKVDEDDDDLDEDVIQSTPQKPNPFILTKRSSLENKSVPPPAQFQDESSDTDSDLTLLPATPRKSPELSQHKNKVTSTPCTNKQNSELISLSPITQGLSVKKKQTPSQQKKQNSILNYLNNSLIRTPPTPNDSKPCIACSRLTKNQLMSVTSLANKKLVTYSSAFSNKVTHMIVATTDRNCTRDHTIKYVSAVAAGIWVLNHDWVLECLEKNCLVDEEKYEVLDVTGVSGPRNSRLNRLSKPLLKGFKIHVAPPFFSANHKDVQKLVEMLGGKVVATPDALLDRDGSIRLIITEAKASQDFVLYENWLQALQVLTLDLEWLSRSIGEFTILPFQQFILCSEENIDELGYPQELLLSGT